jgi:hypothetical protein
VTKRYPNYPWWVEAVAEDGEGWASRIGTGVQIQASQKVAMDGRRIGNNTKNGFSFVN